MGTLTVTVSTVDQVFTSDSATQDRVVYRHSSSTLLVPRTLTLRRVYPKTTKAYTSNARNNMKLSWAVEGVDGAVAPIIWELSVSRVADVDPVQFALSRAAMGLLINDGELDGYFTNLSL